MKRLRQLFRKKKDQNLDGLNKVLIIFSGLYLAQIILLVLFAKDFWVSITTNYLAYDSLLSKSEQIVHGAGTSRLFDLNIIWLLIFILGVSCIGNFILATRYNTKFKAGLKNGNSIFNWVIYGFVSSMLMLVLALLSGIFDISSLIMLFSINIFVYILGWIYHLRLRNDKQLAKFALMSTIKATILPWAVIIIYIFGTFVFGGNSINAWIYLVYLTVLLAQIGLIYIYNQIQNQSGKWKNILFAERAFLTVIFAWQTLVIWQVFFGT